MEPILDGISSSLNAKSLGSRSVSEIWEPVLQKLLQVQCSTELPLPPMGKTRTLFVSTEVLHPFLRSAWSVPALSQGAEPRGAHKPLLSCRDRP